jgi:anti-anti-sigma regulatory factor
MGNGLSISISNAAGRVPVTIFHLKGEIDASTSDQLEASAEQAIQAGTRNLLLDLREVGYISSAGLRALHHIFSRLRDRAAAESDEIIQRGLVDGSYQAAHLKLLNPSPNVAQVLKTAGFDMYLGTYTNLKEALAAF